MGTELEVFMNNMKPELRMVYEEGFVDHKRMIIIELKKLIKRIEDMEAFPTSTNTFEIK